MFKPWCVNISVSVDGPLQDWKPVRSEEAVVPTGDMDQPIFTQEIQDTQVDASELEALMDNLAKDLPPVALPGPDAPQIPSPPKSVAAPPPDSSPQDSLRWSKAHEDRIKINHLYRLFPRFSHVCEFKFGIFMIFRFMHMWYETKYIRIHFWEDYITSNLGTRITSTEIISGEMNSLTSTF